MIQNLIIISVGSFVVSYFVTPLVRSLSSRYQIGDYPEVRKIHTKFVPRMGGIGIITGTFLGISVAYLLAPIYFESVNFNFAGIVISLLMIIGLGVYDDIKGVGSLGKLLVQFIAASIVVSSGLQIEYLNLPFIGPVHLNIVALPITLLWLIGVTNAFNLIDGLDGLAVGVAAIASATFCCIGLLKEDYILVFTTVALFFSCISFLRYNFHPASIFMGDTGSLYLGFLIACISLRVIQYSSSETTILSFFVVIITIAVPIVDTSIAFFRRLKKGMHPLKADKEHIHHRLMDLGLTHRQTVVFYYSFAITSGIIAFTLILVDNLYAVIILSVLLFAILFGIRRLGYLEELLTQNKESISPIRPLSVARIIDRAILVSGDIIALILAFFGSYWFRFHSGLFTFSGFVPLAIYFNNPGLILLVIYWLFLFAVTGLYEIPWDVSRINYCASLVKTVGVGTLILFLVTLDIESLTFEGRITTIVYGLSLAFLLILIRMLIVYWERKYEILGFRRRNTIVIGFSKNVENVLEEIEHRKALKYNIVGFVDREFNNKNISKLPYLGTYDDIPRIVKQKNVEEVLISTTYDTRMEILDIVTRCNGILPTVKAIPENIELLSGFKTEEIIGYPLIRLFPANINRLQRTVKRLIDIFVSLFILIPFLPLWILIGIIIKLDSSGPAFFIQERVGKKGKIFKLYKFRSMVHDAEKETGPVWASLDDTRVTRIGKFLRKLRIDEIPQFVNVLKGEMSLVGPRPERPYFVEQLQNDVKYYSRRLLVRPGITGWAQVKHRYDTSLEDVKEKIKYDLYYLENMSLTLDFKILLRTLIVTLSGKGTH